MLLCALWVSSCGEVDTNSANEPAKATNESNADSRSVTTFPESLPNNSASSNGLNSNGDLNDENAANPINLGEMKEGEKQIVLFFPPDSEMEQYVKNESDDTAIILVDQFETESVRLIEKVSGLGCNINTVEMRDVYMLLADKSIFKVERNKDDKMCGVVLYQPGKAPKVLSGKLKAEAYLKEIKSFFK